MGKIILFKREGGDMSNINVFDIANVFLVFDSMTHKKLQKLCYYAQGWHLALYGKELFNNRIEAWVHGPVSPELYNEYKKFGWEKIPQNIEIPQNIDEQTLNLLKEVYDTYGEYNGDQLEYLTHKEKPWRKARKGVDKLTPSNEEIEKNTMKEYYRDIYERNQND